MEALFEGSLIPALFFWILTFCNFNVTSSLLVDEFEKDDNLLKGANLRVSAFEYPPIMTSRREAGGNVTYSGATVVSLDDITRYFHLRLTYVPVDPAEIAKHGFGIALAHQLQNNQVDFSPYPFNHILEISNLVDLTFPMGIDDFTLMQQFPKEESRLSAPIKPFDYDVWILVILSIIAFIMTTAVVIHTRKRQGLRRQSIFEQLYRRFEYVLTIIASQGNTTPQEFNSFVPRLMVALWLLSMVVLVNAYIGTFTARLAVAKLEPTVDTLEDLAASKTLRMTIELNSEIGYKSMKAESGPYKVFGDTFRKYPDLLFTHPLGSILNVVEHNCVYPGPTNLINLLIYTDFKANRGRADKRVGECRMTTASRLLPYFLAFSAAFQKGSPYTAIFNDKYLLRSWENGGIDYLKRKTFPPIPSQCQPRAGQRMKNTPFTLNDFVGVFVLFIGGVVLSLFIFIVELIVFRFSTRSSIRLMKE